MWAANLKKGVDIFVDLNKPLFSAIAARLPAFSLPGSLFACNRKNAVVSKHLNKLIVRSCLRRRTHGICYSTNHQSVQYVKKCHVMEESGHIAQVFVEAQLPRELTRSVPARSRHRAFDYRAVAMHHNVQLDYRKIKVVEYKPSDDSMLALHPRINGAAFARRAPSRKWWWNCTFRTYSRGTWPSTDNPAQDTFYACTNALASLGFTGFELIISRFSQ